ncbi:TetR/AcrR family transcriptional regulator [Leptospira kanakyensis]|uniref:TetR/AcrR family transcriptional regulator n=1 Tax=Leptospira kanakyensis TaxID=2484968 RepID=A0A6N4Q7Y6_9LEPT|nr:TetR family transcriptional regulator [Leptospira kanakyensis]MCW7481018.1 TetR/AcrR family transcriptional regulator [Leptospira kanakyensis]TGK47810.1 TetR/AcrR family transcriptional regulator [Leptospira kanakyensis]TGK63190.1 TetR/AcrR family transcriptional regulator [Leptospira kanakyensis]TGK66797.1 TetR/AcrR family transcriptional regulator [Leptospira kanakyensis]
MPHSVPKKISHKTSSKRELTKERIYNSAITLFQKEGYESATMRRIAKEARVSLGLTYYHFKTKEEIVLHFYRESQIEVKQLTSQFFKSTRDFKTRLKYIILTQLESFSEYKMFLQVLARHAGDPSHSLSPFSPETILIREEAVGIIREALETSNLKIRDDLAEILPELLWLEQMGLIYFWLSDSSKFYNNTKHLMNDSLELTFKLIKLSNFPLFKNVMGPIFRMYRLVKTNPLIQKR